MPRTSYPTRGRSALLILGGAVALFAGACSSTSAPGWTYPPVQSAAQAPVLAAPPVADPNAAAGQAQGAQAAQQAVSDPAPKSEPQAVPFSLNLTVVTGDMIGHTEFPAFVPSDFTLPANSTVVITITNFDDATALPKGSEQYAKVTGTVDGTAAVTAINAAYPNRAAGARQTVAALNPADVSHTFTIPGLGINVPVAAKARETFTIHTGAPGTYAWRCFDPCGDGPAGWGTAMAMKSGFMEGTLTVV